MTDATKWGKPHIFRWAGRWQYRWRGAGYLTITEGDKLDAFIAKANGRAK